MTSLNSKYIHLLKINHQAKNNRNLLTSAVKEKGDNVRGKWSHLKDTIIVRMGKIKNIERKQVTHVIRFRKHQFANNLQQGRLLINKKHNGEDR